MVFIDVNCVIGKQPRHKRPVFFTIGETRVRRRKNFCLIGRIVAQRVSEFARR